jgi:hypothetical protein
MAAEDKHEGQESNWTASAGLTASLMQTAAALGCTPVDVAKALGGAVTAYEGGYADAVQHVVSYAIATGKVTGGQGPESLAVAFISKVWYTVDGVPVEFHPTFRFGITPDEVVAYIRTLEHVATTFGTRDGWSFKPPRSKPRKPANSGTTATTTTAPAANTALGPNEFVMTHFQRNEANEGSEWRAYGGRLTKHGVKVWPEIALQVHQIMGIDLSAMKAGHKYDVAKFGIVAHYVRKEPTDEYPQGAISKIDAFRTTQAKEE